MHRPRNRFARWPLKHPFLFIAFIVATILVILNWGILLVRPNFRSTWGPDPELGYRNRPNSQTIDYSTLIDCHRLVRYFVGQWGERVAAPGSASELRRPLVLCQGDSATFCQDVPWKERYPAYLAETLKPAAVLGFGVVGYPPSLTPELIAGMTKASPVLIGLVDIHYGDEYRVRPYGRLNARGNASLAAKLAETIEKMGVLHR